MPKKKELKSETDYSHTCDLTKDYMPASVENFLYNREVTVTFDHKRHTRASAYISQAKIVQYLFSWHDIKEIILVVEYQKNGMPHYHINVASDIPFPDGWAFDTMRAFERFYGMTSCKPISDPTAWEEYLFKDVINNNKKKPLCPHYNVYSLND